MPNPIIILILGCFITVLAVHLNNRRASQVKSEFTIENTGSNIQQYPKIDTMKSYK
jgi:hypothetical protein